MSGPSQRRVKKLFGALTAKERAVHIIRAWKEGRDTETEVRWSTPSEQGRELNDLLATARSINSEFALLVLVDEQAAAKLRMRWAWLQSLKAWSLFSDSIRRELVLAVPEYITEDERARRVAELGGEEWTLEQAAQHLTDIDESRDLRGWKAALAAAVTESSLASSGKGKSLRVRYGDLCTWRGEKVPVISEYGLEAEVLDDAGKVAMRREAMSAFGELLERAPLLLASDEMVVEELPEDASMADRTAFQLLAELPVELVELRRELRSVELIIAEARVRLGGEDPAAPMLRDALERAISVTREVVAGLAEEGVEVDLPEPTPEEMKPYREVLQRAVKEETGW